MKFLLSILIFYLVVGFGCGLIPDHKYLKVGSSKSEFDLGTYTEEITLPPTLDEISGLGMDDRSKKILTINDENGIIYYIDPKSKKVEGTDVFASMGDFEGIEMAGEYIYVVKSNGDLIQFDPELKTSLKIETDLRRSNDVEGLGSINDTLFLACKAKTSLKGMSEIKKAKAVYAYSLSSNKLSSKPVILITDDQIEAFLEDQLKEEHDKTNLIKRAKAFSPSGIAVHLGTKEIFVLSDEGKLLIVLDNHKQIRQIHFLNKAQHFKPEGICFSKDGVLFISNEGKHRRGRIFSYHKK